ncbi:MAG: DNA recombination protein RmuC [Phycisphaerales bacterium]|nr:DNA recombination protein RmuC [Phycisphaerales bacterium]
MDILIAVLVGLVAGAALVAAALALRRRQVEALAARLVERSETQRQQDLAAVLERVRASFADLSQQALAASSEQFLRLAETRLGTQSQQQLAALDARKQLIDEAVKSIGEKLATVGTALQALDKDRRESHGAIAQRLDQAAKVVGELQAATAGLREALSSTRRRGQWGERMAEDVLRLVGFVEGVNYTRQQTTAGGTRPDYTFPLPEGRRIHMDVKFPLDNYLKFLDAASDAEREASRAAFLRDVRALIKQVTTREYIDPETGTVDYVLVFIPNEQVYGFVHESAPDLLDEALRQKVVLCSPLTLYALLAVVRQAAENMRVEHAAREILGLLVTFGKEWTRFSELMEKMGRSLEQASQHFEELSTTRTRKLERQLEKIEALRTARHVELPEPGEAS